MRDEREIKLKKEMLALSFDQRGVFLIKTLLEKGYAIQSITDAFLELGWSLKLIDDYFHFKEYVNSYNLFMTEEEGNASETRWKDTMLTDDENLKSIEELSVSEADNETLELIDKLPQIKKIDVNLKDDLKKNNWYKMKNEQITACTFNGMEGKYKGLEFPPNIEFLRLERRTAHHIEDGLKEYTKLERLETYAYPKTLIKNVLNHSTIKELDLNGVKDNELYIDANMKFRELAIEESNIEKCIINSDTMEYLKISSEKVMEIKIENELLNLKKAYIGAKKMDNLLFLEKMKNIDELVLVGAEKIDLEYLTACVPKLKKLEIWKTTELTNVEAIKKLVHLEELLLVGVKKVVVPEENINMNLKEIEIRFSKQEFASYLLKNVNAKVISIYGTKVFDANDLKNIENIEALSIYDVKGVNLNRLKDAIKLKKLDLEILNNTNLYFLRELIGLKELQVAAIPSQKDFLIQLGLELPKKGCLMEFRAYTGEDVSIEMEEIYKNFEIQKYESNNKIKYGIFEDISEVMGKENNNEVELHVQKILKKNKVKRKFTFDSEADNFGVYSENIEDIKWLIDNVILNN